jgi:Tfp pilus assembly protein FimT
MDRWRVHQAVTHLQNVIRLARAQAIRTGSRVVIKAKSAGCRSLNETRNWSCGLTVFQDIHENYIQDSDEPTLREEPEFHALTVIHAGLNPVSYVTYGPHGASFTGARRFEVSPTANPDSPITQKICLSSGGRIRIEAGSGPCPQENS